MRHSGKAVTLENKLHLQQKPAQQNAKHAQVMNLYWTLNKNQELGHFKPV